MIEYKYINIFRSVYMKNKIISLTLVLAMLFGCLSVALPVMSFAQEDPNSVIIPQNEVPLHLYYDEEASHGIDTAFENLEMAPGSSSNLIAANVNDDWERWSIPIGNGYSGVNIFGRTETERLQITEKTLVHPGGSWNCYGGLNSFSETYIDFGHTNSEVTNYSRALDLNTAISTVDYTFGGVDYSREYFISYPDNALVIKLDASETGALDFTLRPTIPWEQSYSYKDAEDIAAGNTTRRKSAKTGTVISSVEDGVGCIEMAGLMTYYDIDFVGLYRVYTEGGTVTASTTTHTWTDRDGTVYNDQDGTIVVDGATSAYIVVTFGTDYVLSSETFTSSDTEKPMFQTGYAETKAKIEGQLTAITNQTNGKSVEEAYAVLKANHLADYQELFGRVTLDLDYDEADFAKTTDDLLTEYKGGSGSSYLEALYYQYGRYLLIASSRKGAVPANLQGAWNRYNRSPWGAGYWHNVNVQMNYWAAFSTNLAETFESYIDYNQAYMAQAEQHANSSVSKYNPDAYGEDGGNGWVIGIGGQIITIGGDRSNAQLGFTTQMFWDYYQFTKDKEMLEEVIYPVLVGAARYMTKCVKEIDGKYLVEHCDSAEQYVNGSWYYTTGTTYAQSFAYLNSYYTLLAAKELGIDLTDEALLSTEDYSILATVMEQIDKYDPIIVGLSGQVKEFREEEYYGDLGEYKHRHISHLVGLFPGDLINSTTPAWLDAAKYTLTERGDNATGWGVAHRLGLWARTKDGDRAYKLIEQLLKVNTATNLWDLHPPFQIDGNFGGTAGIGELLLQSHEGYIAPLAALPSNWANGSYTGMLARDGFEVSAAWADCTATTVNIKSLLGGTARVSYKGITEANLVDSEGNKVNYTVEGKDLISFETEAGETYIISGFKAATKINKVENLQVSKAILGNAYLTWDASPNAVSYNVYTAVESAPAYTLIGNTTNLGYLYTPAVENRNARTTYAVTAVAADGTESMRALAYTNPEDISAYINDLGASIIETSLQITVDSSTYTNKYKVWSREKSSTEYTLVKESGLPVIEVENYDANLVYGVSVSSFYGGEDSEIVDIKNYNAGSGEIDYRPSNILSGKTFELTDEAKAFVHAGIDSKYNHIRLTDGLAINYSDVHTGRFSTMTQDNVMFSGTVKLGSAFILGELRLYDFGAGDTSANWAGNDMLIEAYVNNAWVTVYDLDSNADILKHRVKSSSQASRYLSFDMEGVSATAIRITISAPVSGSSISFWEIECSGIEDPYAVTLNSNLLFGKQPSLFETNSSVNASYPVSKLTDGDFSLHGGRFGLKAMANNYALFVYDLGEETALDTLTIWDHADGSIARSNKTTIELYQNGEWVTYMQEQPLWNSKSDLTQETSAGASSIAKYIKFDLSAYTASQIRMKFQNTNTTSDITLYEIALSGYTVPQPKGEFSDNILADKTFTGNKTPISNSTYGVYGYEKLTDGDFGVHSGRFAIKDEANSTVTLECDLEGCYNLTSLRIFDFFNNTQETRMNEVTVQVLSRGEWITVIEKQPTIYGDANARVNEGGKACTPFALGNIYGNKIRITCTNNASTNTTGGKDKGISIYEIRLSGYKCDEQPDTNILLGTAAGQLTGVGDELNAAFPLTNAFDGKLNTRYAFKDKTGTYTLTVDLGTVRVLHTLSIYDFRDGNDLIGGKLVTRSDKTDIEVYVDGAWIKIINDVPMRVDQSYTAFDLLGVEASKIRITFCNSRTFDKGHQPSASIWEINCTTGGVPVDRSALLEALERLPALDTVDDKSYDYLYNGRYKEIIEKAKNSLATQEEVDILTAEVNAYADTIDSIDLSAMNLSLRGDISMNFRFVVRDAEKLATYPDAYIEFTIPTMQGERTRVVSIKDAEVDSEGRYVISVALAVAQMTDKVTFRTVFEEGVYGNTYSFSIKDYCDLILADDDIESDYPGIKNLLTAMLNYGAYAQKYFAYRESDLANAGITDNVASSTVAIDSKTAIEGEVTGLTLSTWKLSLRTECVATFFLTAENGYSASDYTVTVATPSGLKKTLSPTLSNGRLAIEVEGIGAAFLNDSYVLEITNNADSTTLTVSFTALDYAGSVIADGSDAQLVALSKALKLYSLAADEYAN